MLIQAENIYSSGDGYGRPNERHRRLSRSLANVAISGTRAETAAAALKPLYGFARRAGTSITGILHAEVYLNDEEQEQFDALLQKIARRARSHFSGETDQSKREH